MKIKREIKWKSSHPIKHRVLLHSYYYKNSQYSVTFTFYVIVIINHVIYKNPKIYFSLNCVRKKCKQDNYFKRSKITWFQNLMHWKFPLLVLNVLFWTVNSDCIVPTLKNSQGIIICRLSKFEIYCKKSVFVFFHSSTHSVVVTLNFF